MRDNNITPKAIAEKFGRSEMLVSLVVNKKTTSDKAMRTIAKAIRKDHREVFPEYYLVPKRSSTSKVAQDECRRERRYA